MPSQIKVDEIKNVAGQYKIKTDTFEGQTTAGSIAVQGEGTVTTNLQQGLAKSWTYIHGTDTFAIINSFNTTSATDNGSGDYTTVRTNAFSNDDFATAGICSATAGSDPHYNFVVENVDSKLRTTTSLRTYILNARGDQSTNDAPDFSITFMGDLA